MTAEPVGLIALVVDDEAPARSELRYLLEQDERIAAVLVAASGTDALRMLESEKVDVVFSDISMPGLDGMELARVLARFASRPAVVFVTAHDQHAVEAFAIDAVDYVMKPVRPARLAEAVRRVIAGVTPAAPETRDEDETIPVELGGVTRFVPAATSAMSKRTATMPGCTPTPAPTSCASRSLLSKSVGRQRVSSEFTAAPWSPSNTLPRCAWTTARPPCGSGRWTCRSAAGICANCASTCCRDPADHEPRGAPTLGPGPGHGLSGAGSTAYDAGGRR